MEVKMPFWQLRVTREVSDNLVKYDYISWLALWCYVGSSNIVAGFNKAVL